MVDRDERILAAGVRHPKLLELGKDLEFDTLGLDRVEDELGRGLAPEQKQWRKTKKKRKKKGERRRRNRGQRSIQQGAWWDGAVLN